MKQREIMFPTELLTKQQTVSPQRRLWCTHAEACRSYQSEKEQEKEQENSAPHPEEETISYHVWEQAVRDALNKL